MKDKINYHPASFRDPSGNIFFNNDKLHRIINPIYFKIYYSIKKEGIYEFLFKNQILIPHKETFISEEKIILTPEKIPFITNPYEWSFNQYKDSALLTLKIHKYLLTKGFILKDASAYNISFHKGKPIFIDTLSFDFYEKNTPWRGYKQFISHFLGPLVLAKYHGVEIFKMLQTHIDGIPISLISSLLPNKTKLSPTLYTNIHLVAKIEEKYNEDYNSEININRLSYKSHCNIIDNLYNYINKLEINRTTEWGDYYKKINYNELAFTSKKRILNEWVLSLKPNKLIDIGGNDGCFSRMISHKLKHILVTDIDAVAVDKNYIQCKENEEKHILPIVCDVLQPPASIGFNNKERSSFLERLKIYSPDVTLALALIHHITLSGNIPFEKSAAFFAKFSKNLILEFPKRGDSWVDSLLQQKREFINHFDFYNIEAFEKAYKKYFKVIKKVNIDSSQRVIYLFKKINE